MSDVSKLVEALEACRSYIKAANLSEAMLARIDEALSSFKVETGVDADGRDDGEADLTAAYMAGLERGKDAGREKGFREGIEAAAKWHDAEAAISRTRWNELYRYDCTEAEHRNPWRSWKDRDDSHRYAAASIRSLSSQRPADIADRSDSASMGGGE